MTEQDPFDAALSQHFHGEGEPGDAGFSLRVMAALPGRVARHRRREARWIRHAHWVAASCAASGAAILLTDGQADPAHALAGLTLMALLIFWALPSRWSRG